MFARIFVARSVAVEKVSLVFNFSGFPDATSS
jgi:hypothetical protein